VLSRLAVGAVVVLAFVAAADALRGRGDSAPPPASGLQPVGPYSVRTDAPPIPPECRAPQPPSDAKRSVVIRECRGAWMSFGPSQVSRIESYQDVEP
jgi:hypothetical protein